MSYQDLQMATGILLNHLDTAAVNALVVWLCKVPTWNAKKFRLFFARIGFVLIRPQTERHLMQQGMCLEETFRGGSSGKCPGVMYGGIVQDGKYPRENVQGEMLGFPCRITISLYV